MTDKKEQTGEHAATNKDVDASNKKWSITTVSATFVALSALTAVLTGFWSTAVEAGGKGTFVTIEQHTAVVKQVEALDAGVQEQLKKMQADADRRHQEYREDMKEMTKALRDSIKQRGGK